MQARATVTDLLGRDDALERAGALLDPRPGSGALVVLTGGAGIGKTFLAGHLLDRLPADLDRAFGAPIGHIATPALWPWRQAARGIARTRPGGPLDEALRMLDDRGSERLTDLAVAERLVDALADEAVRQPFALHLEDVHQFDEQSLTLLGIVVETLGWAPMRIVACCRADASCPAPVTSLLATLAGRPAVEVVPVPAAPDDALALLLRQTCGDLEEDALRHAVRLSAGNPLFAVELARAHRDGTEGVTLGRLVEDRVRALEADGVLAALALLGRPATAALLATATGAAVPAVRQVVDRAAATGVVEVAGSIGLVSFSHPLFADAVLAGLPPQDARTLHRRLADLVDPTRGGPGPQVVERARHLVAAGDETDETARSCLAAAVYEENVGSLAGADELAVYGLDTVGDDVTTRVHLLRVRGRVAARAGDFDRARDALQQAVDHARRSADRAAFVRAVIDLTTVEPQYMDVERSRRTLLEEALEHAVGPASRATLLCRLSDMDYLTDFTRSSGYTSRALEVARESGDESLVAMVLERVATSRFSVTGLEEFEDVARSVHGSLTSEDGTGLAFALVPAFCRGNRAAIDDVLHRVGRGHQRVPAIRGRGMVDLARLSLAVADGDAEAVERHSRALSEYATADQQGPAVPLLLLWWTLSGRQVRLDRPFQMHAATSSELNRVLTVAGTALAALGGQPGAREALKVLVEPRGPLLAPRADITQDVVTAVLGLAGYVLRDAELCRTALDRVGACPDRFALVAETVLLGPVGWVVALARMGLDDREGALAANQAALAACRRAGYRAWWAHCLLQRAWLLEPVDPQASAECSDQAHRIGLELGLTAVVERSRRTVAVDPARRAGLSPAQEKVLAMAAAGLTNEQIGVRLGIAVSTVEKHLTQVYRRLGVPNRAASVRWYSSQQQRT